MAATLVIVFSGFRDEELKAQIEANQIGRVVSALSNKVTHLIMKENSKPSKKVDEAKEAGVEIVLLDDFLAQHGLSLVEKPKVKKVKMPAPEEQVVESSDEVEVHTETKEEEEAPAETKEVEEVHIETKVKKVATKKAKKVVEPVNEVIEVPKKKIVSKKKVNKGSELVDNPDVTALINEIEATKQHLMELEEKLVKLMA